MNNKALTTRTLKNYKLSEKKSALSMLTCYDYQTAQLLDQTQLDLILVGDSLGNVVLGYDHTTSVSVEEMITFGSAVTRGAKNKFVVVDLPFGSYSTLEQGIDTATKVFQKTNAQAIKFEGAFPYQLELVERLTQIGIPVMGHIGLTPQSVHQMGGYYVHGKDKKGATLLMDAALALEKAGAFAIVLECVEHNLSTNITNEIKIPTIGIGSGNKTDGQVLVINDLLQFGQNPVPKFCTPIANLYSQRLELINKYINGIKTHN